MPKTPSVKLYKLVKSLSRTEKRHFTLFVSGKTTKSSSKYLELFKAIAAQDTYNEESLILLIYGTNRVEGKKFSELKPISMI